MITQYILKLKNSKLSALTKDPACLYWNRGLQREIDSINPVSLFYTFVNIEPKTDEEIELEQFRTNAYPIEIDGYAHLSWDEIKSAAWVSAKNELTMLENSAQADDETEEELKYFLK